MCRQMDQRGDYYNWRSATATSAARGARAAQLRTRMLAEAPGGDLTLDRHILQEVIKKKSDHRRRRTSRNDTRLLSAQCCRSCLLAVSGTPRVLPIASPDKQRAAASDCGSWRRPGRASATNAAHPVTREGWRVGRNRCIVVQAGGPPGSYESASAQAHQPHRGPAPVATSGGHTGHGLRP